MKEKDYLTTMLTIEKAMVKNYAVAMTEASNDVLNEKFHKLYDEANELQRKIYNLMSSKGWYKLEAADENKIQNKINTMTTDFNQLSSNQ